MAAELIRRGARVEFNPYGYGPEDFNIPKVACAKSLLQHTEQLHHEQNVCAAWTYFRRQAEKSNYSIKCKSVCRWLSVELYGNYLKTKYTCAYFCVERRSWQASEDHVSSPCWA